MCVARIQGVAIFTAACYNSDREMPMKIKWYGTATLLIESGGTRLLIDPYLKPLNRKLPPVNVEEAATARAVFVTHPHTDHFTGTDAVTSRGVKEVYVSENGIRHAGENGMDVSPMLPLRANELHRIGDLTVRTYQSRHCKFDAATVLRIVFSLRTWAMFPRGVRLLREIKRFRIGDDIYALEISDGEKTVMVLGSAGLDADTVYPQNVDLLVFPYQGRVRMDRYMRPFLEVLRPKAVMLDHFDNAFPPFTHRVNTKKFQAALKECLPSARGVEPVEGEWYEI